jgi:hypothetical protein
VDKWQSDTGSSEFTNGSAYFWLGTETVRLPQHASLNDGMENIVPYCNLSDAPLEPSQPTASWLDTEIATTSSPWTTYQNYELLFLGNSTAQLSFLDRLIIRLIWQLIALRSFAFFATAAITWLALGMLIYKGAPVARSERLPHNGQAVQLPYFCSESATSRP